MSIAMHRGFVLVLAQVLRNVFLIDGVIQKNDGLAEILQQDGGYSDDDEKLFHCFY
jgi:hypothetical protein